MTEPLYVSRAAIEPVGHLHRRARLARGVEVEFGVHGPIREFFGLETPVERLLPVDFVVAALGGCMLGTLVGALEVRQVALEPGALIAESAGTNQVRDGIPVLTAIHVSYRMRIPAGTREKVERALARHQDKCPTAVSLKGAVAVSWSADIEETPAGA